MTDKSKNVVEVVLMPLVVAIVGTVGTYLITKQQQESADALSSAQMESVEARSKAERQIRIIEIFFEDISSKNDDDRILALEILKELDADLAQRLSKAVRDREEEDSEVWRTASRVANEAVARAEQQRALLIQQLFSDSAALRTNAYDQLIANWASEKALISEVIAYARLNPDNENGVYNTVVLLSHMNRDTIKEEKEEITKFSREAESIGPKTKERAATLRSRLE